MSADESVDPGAPDAGAGASDAAEEAPPIREGAAAPTGDDAVADAGELRDTAAAPAGDDAGVGEADDAGGDAPAEAAAPLSWAERAALARLNDHHASSSSTAPAPAPVLQMVDVKLTKDSVIDYLLWLAEAREGAAPEGELPSQLQKFDGCERAGVPTTARVSHCRLGLINTANNCYVSVVAHALLPCNALVWVLRRCSANDPRRPVTSCLVALFKEFFTRKADSQGEVLNMFLVPQVKEVLASWQKLGAQQDAGEFFGYLLSQLHDECKWKVHLGGLEEGSPTSQCLSSGAPSAADCGAEEAQEEQSAWAHVVKTSQRQVELRAAGLHEDSPITRIFGGLLRSSVRSKGAKADSVSLEPFNRLDLDISSTSVNSVRKALEGFFNPEAVNDGNAMRRLRIERLPKVLILSLKRFAFAQGGARKIHKAITYDEKLALPPAWLAEGAAPLDYWVTAVICHHGDTVHRGHYTAFVRYNADWYMYDDTTVRKVEGKEVAAQHFTVYLLVYQSRADVDMSP